MVFAKDAENCQRGGEQGGKGNDFTALGFEKIEEVARFHISLWVDGWDGHSEHW